MQYNMFERVIKQIRDVDVPTLIDRLTSELEQETETFDASPTVLLHSQNRKRIHYLLARMADFVATESEQESRYTDYVNSYAKDAYEIEHILPSISNGHIPPGFTSAAEYDDIRNEIGCLLLLRRSVNASLGGKTYREKLKIYSKQQNLLAQALASDPGQHNPRFCKFCKSHDLTILREPVTEFDLKAVEARRELCQELANLVWNPNVLRKLGSGHL